MLRLHNLNGRAELAQLVSVARRRPRNRDAARPPARAETPRARRVSSGSSLRSCFRDFRGAERWLSHPCATWVYRADSAPTHAGSAREWTGGGTWSQAFLSHPAQGKKKTGAPPVLAASRRSAALPAREPFEPGTRRSVSRAPYRAAPALAPLRPQRTGNARRSPFSAPRGVLLAKTPRKSLVGGDNKRGGVGHLQRQWSGLCKLLDSWGRARSRRSRPRERAAPHR